MQSEKRSDRRGTVLIDRQFQLRFIGRLAAVLFFYLLIFLVISVVAPVAFTFLGDTPDWALTETAFRVEVVLRLILAPLICTFLCLFAHGVLETFKIAGPHYRFKAVFRDLIRWRVPRGVQVRKGDYLRDTCDEFDTALVQLHDTIAGLQKESRAASASLRAVFGEQASDEAARAAMESVGRIEAELARFELVTKAPMCQPIEAPAEVIEPMNVPDEVAAR